MTPDLPVGNSVLILFFFLFFFYQTRLQGQTQTCKCERMSRLSVIAVLMLHMCLLARSHVSALPIQVVYGSGN